MRKTLRGWVLCARGQGLIEYALILALVAVSLVSVLLLLRNSTGTAYSGVQTHLDQAVACDGSPACVAGQTGGTESGDNSGGGTVSGPSNGGQSGGSPSGGNGNGNNGKGNGKGNNGNGNGNGGGNGSNGQGGGQGNNP